VYFTTYCLLAKKHNVKVLSLCQMPDHVHDTVVVKKVEQLSCFKQEVNSRFSCFSQFASLLLKDGRFNDIHEVLSLPKLERAELFVWLRERTDAMSEQIAHYLRLPLGKIREM